MDHNNIEFYEYMSKIWKIGELLKMLFILCLFSKRSAQYNDRIL